MVHSRAAFGRVCQSRPRSIPGCVLLSKSKGNSMSNAALRTTTAARLVPPLPHQADDDHVSVRTWVAVVGAAFGAFLAIVNIQIVSSSLADIQGAIGAGSDDGGWITTAYLVAEIIVIPISGWLARVFSLRTYLLTNTFLFLVLTVACAFTTTLGQMIVVRAMQGFAGGVLIPLAFSIIMTRLPPSRHPVGLSIYAISAIFAPAIGPVIGGYCNETYGWQSIFFVNLLPGAVMFAMLWFSLDPSPRQFDLLRRGDWVGIVTIAIGLDRAGRGREGRLVRIAVHRAIVDRGRRRPPGVRACSVVPKGAVAAFATLGTTQFRARLARELLL